MTNEIDGAEGGEEIRLLPFLIGNPVTRRMLSGMNRFCEKCGKNRLEVALELYAGTREEACTACTLTRLPLAAVVSAGARSFGVEEEAIKRTLGDPYWRKGLLSVVRGITDFGIKRPFTPGAPFQVVWDVTRACNLRCKHCYASAGEPLEDELTTYEALDLIDRLAAMGVPIIAFSGGEPLIRGDIVQLTRHAHKRGIYVAMATNGTLLTESKATELRTAGVETEGVETDPVLGKEYVAFRHTRTTSNARPT
jgi:hypothetical protein